MSLLRRVLAPSFPLLRSLATVPSICSRAAYSIGSGGKLEGKVALVTGGGSGLGKDICLKYAEHGAQVYVADINLDGANKTAAEIVNKKGQGAPLRMDVTNEEEVDSVVNSVVKDAGKLDIIVVNAGIQHIDPITNLSYADWRKVVSIHLDGSFLCTRAAMRAMKECGGGSIIYMGSVHSKVASMLKAPYVSAKHGILGLCRVAAKEGAEYNVRANVICPGYVWTPLVANQVEAQAKNFGISEDEVIKKIFLKDTADGEFTTLDDISEAALFLASFKTNALTGQSLIVSHGWTME